MKFIIGHLVVGAGGVDDKDLVDYRVQLIQLDFQDVDIESQLFVVSRQVQ